MRRGRGRVRRWVGVGVGVGADMGLGHGEVRGGEFLCDIEMRRRRGQDDVL